MSEAKSLETHVEEQASCTETTAATSAAQEGDGQKGGGCGQAGDPGKDAFNTPLGALKTEN